LKLKHRTTYFGPRAAKDCRRDHARRRQDRDEAAAGGSLPQAERAVRDRSDTKQTHIWLLYRKAANDNDRGRHAVHGVRGAGAHQEVRRRASCLHGVRRLTGPQANRRCQPVRLRRYAGDKSHDATTRSDAAGADDDKRLAIAKESIMQGYRVERMRRAAQ
jgi:hypothetical protein